MIPVQYSCDDCGVKDALVLVPPREAAEDIEHWIEHALQTIYFFSHTTTKSLTPEMSNHFLTQINQRLGLDLKLATIIGNDSELFTI